MYIKSGLQAMRLMPYDSVTDRSSPGGGALVPCEQAREIVQMATQQSAVLNMFKRVSITTNAKSFPVVSALPEAYFLDTTNVPTSDTALFQTTEMAWKNVDMNVAEIGVIAPFPRRLVSDVASGGVNITQELMPLITQAIAKKIDRAVFFGADKPAAWPTAVAPAAIAAGNTQEAIKTVVQGGLHSDVLSLLKKIRADGFTPNAAIGRPTFEFDLLDERDTTGQPLFVPEYGATSPTLGPLAGRLLGRSVQFATDAVFPADTPGSAQLVFFDSTKLMVGIREDLHFEVFNAGVITDASGAIVYNLMQQDMIAVRLLMRVGIAVANPITLSQSTESARYPAGVLLSDDGVA